MERKRILYVVLIVGVALGTLIALPFFLKTPHQNSPTPVIIPTSYPQRTTIRKTTVKEVENRSDLIGKEKQPNGSTEYQFKSVISDKPDTAITRNGVVIYEQIITPLDPDAQQYKTVTGITKEFGPPDEIIDGSADFGNLMNTFVYPQKGFAFVGSLRTNQVYQLQYFEPMTIEQYKKTYGKGVFQQNSSE
jgi:hypothetical protein